MTTAPGPAVIARRPSARRPLTIDVAITRLDLAQAEFRAAEDAYNAAVHARGQAAAEAHDEAGMAWTAIGGRLGDIRGHTVQELAGRYHAAVAAGRTLAIGRSPQSKRKHPHGNTDQ